MFDGFLIPIFQGTIGETTKKKIAKWENSRTFYIILMQLINIALDFRYKFTGLPDTIDERVIKQSLLFYGNTTLFTLDGVPIGLPSAPDGKNYDLYGNAGASWIFSKNGRMNFSVPLNYKYSGTKLTDAEYLLGADIPSKAEVKNGVIIWENKTRTPFIWTVLYFAERIADTYRTLDMDRRWLKRPFIPRCEESEGKSFDESLKAFMNNEDFSVSLKARTLDKTDIFSVDLPSEIITHVTQLIEWYYSQYKMLCGIDANSQVDKKGENLISDEVNIDALFTDYNANSIIEYINEQTEIYNKLTGESIRAEMPETKKQAETPEPQEGADDGEKENVSDID